MDPSVNIENFLDQAQRLRREGKEFETVRRHLAESGADETTIDTIISQVKSSHYLKCRKRGTVLGVCGSILLALGFLLTVIFYHSGISIHVVMYGMTSVGAILLVAGMIDIIGW